jgi:hypothetical protein
MCFNKISLALLQKFSIDTNMPQNVETKTGIVRSRISIWLQVRFVTSFADRIRTILVGSESGRLEPT